MTKLTNIGHIFAQKCLFRQSKLTLVHLVRFDPLLEKFGSFCRVISKKGLIASIRRHKIENAEEKFGFRQIPQRQNSDLVRF